MSHEVESMAFAHETPWHGLGVPVSDDLTPAQMCVAAGCDWTVSKRKIYTGTPDIAAPGDILHTPSEVPNKMALCRDSDGRFFDIVSDRWNPVQNADLFETFKKFCTEGGATMETAGALKGGQIVWALANLGNGFVLPGGDAVKGYLLLASKHEHGFATIGRVTPVRVVCANTFAMAGGFGAAQLRVPHTREFDPEWAAEQMGLAREGMTEFERNAKLLQSLNISRDDAITLLQPVYQQDTDAKDIIRDFDARANRTVKGIMKAALDGAGQDVGDGTGWHMWNGATFYANHTARGTKDGRLSSTLLGQNNRNLNKLFASMLEMAEG